MSGPPVYNLALGVLDAGFENIADLNRAKQADELETRLERQGRAILEAGGSWPQARPYFDKAEELDRIELRLHTGVIERQRTANGLLDRMLSMLAGILGMRKAS